MPGFYPRTTPKSRSPPKRRIADLRFAALLDDDDDEASSTISSNNSSDDSLFLHLEEESLLDITRSEIVPSSPTPSDEEDADNLLGIMPLDKLDQLQRKLVDPQDIVQSLDYNDKAEDDRSNISPTTTAINLLPTTTKLNNRQSYPMLNDKTNNSLDNMTDAINYPIQVEMATSAFLKNPTPELWNELVSCFRYMMYIKNNNNNLDGLQNDIWLEEEVNGSPVEFTSDEISHNDLNLDNEDERWATFDDEKDDLMNSSSKVSTARLPTVDTISTTVKDHNHEPTSFEFIGNVEVNQVLSNMPKEEKTMFNQIFPEMTNEKNRNEEEDVWSEERDVSPPSSPYRVCDDDERSSSSEYNPDLISLGQSSQDESTTSQLNESIESSEASYVLNEVSHWEKRIDKYDQRYVNVVAAALEGENTELNGEWMDGQILEVSPVDNEEVLYVV